MKKLLAMFLCVVLVLAVFAGCSKTDETPETEQPQDSNETTGNPENPDAENSGDETPSADASDYKVVMIVKQSDSWFDDMATGVEQLKNDTGLNVSVQVPETGDAAQQISIMEDLIAPGCGRHLRGSQRPRRPGAHH